MAPEQRKRPVCPLFPLSGKQRTSERTRPEEDHEKRRIVSAESDFTIYISVLLSN